MILDSHRIPVRRALAVAVMALFVAACILAPGKFTSKLELKKNREFSFDYTGEILMIPLMQTDKEAPFEPEACHDEDTGEDRTCTVRDLAQQKADWQKARDDKRKSDAEAAQALLGGLDPTNPQAGYELATKLRRQVGWKKVEYLGDGKFDVEFAISGTLDHDFVFPTIEGLAMSNPFVQVVTRDDGVVRVEAPAFGPQAGGTAMAGMMSGMASGSSDAQTSASQANGTFTLVTKGEILANNTDEGPQSASGGKALSWKITARTPAAPSALVKLSK
ncbi:MAG TPA: hypothetical protein VMQ93_10290 [Novosphingobium sp.]|nr:hypothetical protein [Novosphingobium sp.]